MFKKLSEMFNSMKSESNAAHDPSGPNGPMTTELAVAALLVHLACIDGDFDSNEHSRINDILKKHFDLQESEVELLIQNAQKKDSEAVDFYQFTSLLTQQDMDQRIQIIAMMWSVVFADDHNHELEDNMVWRVAELIGVSSRDRTVLRAQMRDKAKLEKS